MTGMKGAESKMSSVNRKKHKKKFGFIYVIYFVVLLLAVSSVSYSRYILSSSGGGGARLAKPVIEFINNASPELSDFAPGETKTYTYKIVNFENGNVNEVALDYYFEFAFENINSPELLDIEYDLYYKPSESAPKEHVGMTAEKANRSNKIRVLPNNRNEQIFFLEVKWNMTQLSDAYAGTANRFIVSTVAQQVD